jgi:hypothetical protein
MLARLQNLNIYMKMNELKECKSAWGSSSSALKSVFGDLATVVIQMHSDEFVMHDSLSGHMLNELAELSGTSPPALALDLIKIFAAPNIHLPAAVWMGLATIECKRAAEGVGQAALQRLLRGNAAKLSSSVVDGAWKAGLYPAGKQSQIAAGLIWLMLGSPTSAERWMAAHSLICFAFISCMPVCGC